MHFHKLNEKYFGSNKNRKENPDIIREFFQFETFSQYEIQPLIIHEPNPQNPYNEKSFLYIQPEEKNEKQLVNVVPHNKFFKLNSTKTYVDTKNYYSLNSPKFLFSECEVIIDKSISDKLDYQYSLKIILESIKRQPIFLNCFPSHNNDIFQGFLSSTTAIRFAPDIEDIRLSFHMAVDLILESKEQPFEKTILLNSTLALLNAFNDENTFTTKSTIDDKPLVHKIILNGFDKFLDAILLEEDADPYFPYIIDFIIKANNSHYKSILKEDSPLSASILDKINRTSFFQAYPSFSNNFYNNSPEFLFKDALQVIEHDSITNTITLAIDKKNFFNDCEHSQQSFSQNSNKEKFKDLIKDFVQLIQFNSIDIDDFQINYEETLSITLNSSQPIDIKNFIEQFRFIAICYKEQSLLTPDMEQINLLFQERILTDFVKDIPVMSNTVKVHKF